MLNKKKAFVEQHAPILQQEAMLQVKALFRLKWKKEVTRTRSEMEQKVVHIKVELKQEARMKHEDHKKQEDAWLNRANIELKTKAQREAAAAKAETRILEFDDSQALGDLADEVEDPLQRVQDFVNTHPDRLS